MKQTASKECCKIDAVVTVDPKGQIVLPKNLREKANIQPSDKLAIIGVEQENQVCCIVLMKTESLEDTVKCKLAPILNGAFGNGDEKT
ncbi:MAG: HgcAB-associated protein HgcC [Candidatus Bathyarchaeia archaeon]|jgi:AbrB family looped-hinge helix DNA binding protein